MDEQIATFIIIQNKICRIFAVAGSNGQPVTASYFPRQISAEAVNLFFRGDSPSQQGETVSELSSALHPTPNFFSPVERLSAVASVTVDQTRLLNELHRRNDDFAFFSQRDETEQRYLFITW